MLIIMLIRHLKSKSTSPTFNHMKLNMMNDENYMAFIMFQWSDYKCTMKVICMSDFVNFHKTTK